MKLSICIPVYNFDVRNLVFDLIKEINLHKIDAEIILIDDASTEKFNSINKELQSEVSNFVFLDKNIGRSNIRNLFLKYAQGDYFLYLDCDGKIIDPYFLNKYIDFIKENPNSKVIYGGRTVTEREPFQDFMLRWKFAKERENLTLKYRLKIPFLSFQTNNFIIKKDVLQKNLFNPKIVKYGYEDLLFAMDLQSNTIKIDHIDNPIFNDDIEKSDVYLSKVEDSVDSLAIMLSDEFTKNKMSEIKLVKAYHLISKFYVSKPISILLSLFENRFKQNLLSQNPNLRNLDLYKLSLLLNKMKK